MNRIRQPEDRPAHADVCREFELPFDLSSALFSPACGDSTQAIFAPLHYEPKYAYPLLVWLHGPGDDQRQLLRIMPLVSLRNYVAVAPQGILSHPQEDYRWRQTPGHIEQAEQRIFESMAAVSERYNFSRRKVFLAGFDCGGTMALRAAMDNPDRFAGAISLCGKFPRGHHPFANIAAARNMPVFLAVGRMSEVYTEPEVCDDLRLLHSAGISVSLRQYPCGHEISPQMLKDVDRWIIEQITTLSRPAAYVEETWK